MAPPRYSAPISAPGSLKGWVDRPGLRYAGAPTYLAGWVIAFAPAPMGPPPLVVLDVHPEHTLEVPTAQDEHPVQALGPDRADPTLGEGVGLRYSCMIRGPPWQGTLGPPHTERGGSIPLDWARDRAGYGAVT